MMNLAFDRQHIWHPYTSMTKPLPNYPVVAADGVKLTLESGAQLIDGMSSWWAAVHGYNHPELNQAAKDQIDKMAHVMFGGITHPSAIELCQQLVAITPAGLDKVFLSDSGSVAVEVAIKMALQYWMSLGQPNKHKFVALKQGYHGDTFAAMGVCDPHNSMHSLYQGVVAENFFAPAPQCGFDQNWDGQDIEPLKTLLEAHQTQIAALILEPIVQGAGGMRIYHPQYLVECQKLCQQYDILLIFDEIATGFGRTGKLFAANHANISPDIMCLGKALTGGYLSLAATLCSDKVATGICQGQAGVLMHGPTFMGNPLACAIAVKSIELLQRNLWQDQVNAIECQLKAELQPLASHPQVADVRVLGAIGVVELKQPLDVASKQKRLVELGVWIRPFGKLFYIMPPFIIKPAELSALTSAMATVINELAN